MLGVTRNGGRLVMMIDFADLFNASGVASDAIFDFD